MDAVSSADEQRGLGYRECSAGFGAGAEPGALHMGHQRKGRSFVGAPWAGKGSGQGGRRGGSRVRQLHSLRFIYLLIYLFLSLSLLPGQGTSFGAQWLFLALCSERTLVVFGGPARVPGT